MSAAWELGLYPGGDAEPLRGDLVALVGSWLEDGPEADDPGVWEATYAAVAKSSEK